MFSSSPHGGPSAAALTLLALVVALSTAITSGPSGASPSADPPDASAGPAVGPATLIADPATGLVDGQVIMFSGDGHPADSELRIWECAATATDLGGCGWVGPAHADGGGSLNGYMGAYTRLLPLAGGPAVDCRTSACVAVVLADGVVDPNTDISSAPRVALSFDPNGPDEISPTATVEPAKDLVDGQIVTLTGAGFRPGQLYAARLCAGERTNDPSLVVCQNEGRGVDILVAAGAPDVGSPSSGPRVPDGSFSVDVTLQRVFGAGLSAVSVDCALVDCFYAVGGYETFRPVGHADTAPLRFRSLTSLQTTPRPIAAAPSFTG